MSHLEERFLWLRSLEQALADGADLFGDVQDLEAEQQRRLGDRLQLVPSEAIAHPAASASIDGGPQIGCPASQPDNPSAPIGIRHRRFEFQEFKSPVSD